MKYTWFLWFTALLGILLATSAVKASFWRSYEKLLGLLFNSNCIDDHYLFNDESLLFKSVYDFDLFDPRLITAIWVNAMKDNVFVKELPFQWRYFISQDFEELSLDVSSFKPYLESRARYLGKHYLNNIALKPDTIVLLTNDNSLVYGSFDANLKNIVQSYEISLELDLSEYVDILNTTGFSLNEEVDELKQLLHDMHDVSDEELPNNNFNYTLSHCDFIFDSPIAETQGKFFHEANLTNGEGLHYDWRFFSRSNHSGDERKYILHRLSRAWLQFANSLHLKTWLGHGTLLGWYWNGMNLPWDNDIDVQITASSLQFLAQHYNNTVIIDLSIENSYINQGFGRFLLEVDTNFLDRRRENGDNNIDARFIDIDTGFYVDITALALTSTLDEMKYNSSDEFNQVLDEQFLEKKSSSTISSQDLIDDFEHSKELHRLEQDIYNCRNNHFYLLEDLEPLTPTLFEGVKAFVPNRFRQIIQREYPKGLYNYQFADHTFRPVLRLWVPSNICPKDPIGDNCDDKKVLAEAELTRSITLAHRQQVLNKFHNQPIDNLRSTRKDIWFSLRQRVLLNRFEL